MTPMAAGTCWPSSARPISRSLPRCWSAFGLFGASVRLRRAFISRHIGCRSFFFTVFALLCLYFVRARREPPGGGSLSCWHKKVTKEVPFNTNAHLTERVNQGTQPHRWRSGLRCGQSRCAAQYHRDSEVRERQPYRPTVRRTRFAPAHTQRCCTFCL